MSQTQLLKGVLEGCVLALIAQRESYGYELIQALHRSGFTSIVGGTLYPLLAKLEQQDTISGTLRPSADGPERKYFTLTAQGQARLDEFKDEWHKMQTKVAQVLEDDDNDA